MNQHLEKAQHAAEAPDADVVQKVLSGDRRAFETLMRRHNQKVFRTARAVLRNDDAAEDAAQQAWVSIYTHLDQWTGGGSFSSWALTIVVRECVRRKTRLEHAVPEGAEPESFEPSPEDELQRRRLRQVLEHAVDRLPDSLRTVLVLRDIEGLTSPEVGAVLGLTEEAVRVRLHRAHRSLREVLADQLDVERMGLFPFLGARCAAITARVLAALDDLPSA